MKMNVDVVDYKYYSKLDLNELYLVNEWIHLTYK